MGAMVDHEEDQLDLVEGFEKLEMVVPLGSVSVREWRCQVAWWRWCWMQHRGDS